MLITLVLYLNGTGASAELPQEGQTSLVNILHTLTVVEENSQISICKPGCAVETQHRMDFGVVFAHGLQQQINETVKGIRQLATENNNLNIKLIIVGFSRGAIGAFEVCRQVHDLRNIEAHVVAIDPVPGNPARLANLSSALGMGNNLTWANKIADLTFCRNLRSVEILFSSQKVTITPNSWLQNIAASCLDSILPVLPSNQGMSINVDVVPGHHGEIDRFLISQNTVSPLSKKSLITWWMVYEHLQKLGVRFEERQLFLDPSLKDSQALYQGLQAELALITHSECRTMHLNNKILVQPNKNYLNLYHQEKSGVDLNYQECALTVSDCRPSLQSVSMSQLNSAWQAYQMVDGVLQQYATVINEKFGTEIPADPMERGAYYLEKGGEIYENGVQVLQDSTADQAVAQFLKAITTIERPSRVQLLELATRLPGGVAMAVNVLNQFTQKFSPDVYQRSPLTVENFENQFPIVRYSFFKQQSVKTPTPESIKPVPNLEDLIFNTGNPQKPKRNQVLSDTYDNFFPKGTQ